jgi:hypothetical protein
MVSPLVQALSFQNSARPAQSPIAPTDVVGSYRLASDIAEKNFEARLAKENAQFGGLAQIGGAGVAAFGPKLGATLFGSPAVAPAAEGTPAVPGLIPGLFGKVFGSGAAAANAPASAVPSAVTGAAPAVPWAPSTATLPWPGGATTLADNSVLPAASAPTAGEGSVGSIDIASLFPNAAPTVAGDFATAAGAGAPAGTVAADLAASGAAAGGATDVASALAPAAAGGAADAGAAAASSLPDWLMSFLPFLAAA